MANILSTHEIAHNVSERPENNKFRVKLAKFKYLTSLDFDFFVESSPYEKY